MTIAGLIHVGFFVAESLVWKRQEVYRVFGTRSAEEAEILSFVMSSQGFCNLFLALGTFFGVASSAVLFSHEDLVLVSCALLMVGAAVVLVAGNRRL